MGSLYKPDTERGLCVADTAAGKTNSLHIPVSFYKCTARLLMPVSRAISCQGNHTLSLNILQLGSLHQVPMDHFAVMMFKSKWCH